MFKLFIFLFSALSLFSADNSNPISVKQDLSLKRTFLDSPSFNFDKLKSSKLEKYNFYVSTFDCISKSLSKSDILNCENVLKVKLATYNRNLLKDSSVNQDKYLISKESLKNKPEFNHLVDPNLLKPIKDNAPQKTDKK